MDRDRKQLAGAKTKGNNNKRRRQRNKRTANVMVQTETGYIIEGTIRIRTAQDTSYARNKARRRKLKRQKAAEKGEDREKEMCH